MSPTPSDKFRPPASLDFAPDWRWQAIIKLSEEYNELPRSIRMEDPDISKGFHYHRQSQTAHTEANRLHLRFECPDTYEAFTIYSTPGAKSKWVLEALLLSGADLEEISNTFPISKQVALLYESLFYDIRHLLKYPLYILTNVLDPALLAFRDDCDLQWKMIAYLGGASRFLQFMNLSHEFKAEDWEWFCRLIRNSMMRNAFSASVQMRPSPLNEIDLQDLHMKFEQGMRLAGQTATNSPEEEWMGGIVASLGSMLGKDGGLVLEEIKKSGKIHEPKFAERMLTAVETYTQGESDGA